MKKENALTGDPVSSFWRRRLLLRRSLVSGVSDIVELLAIGVPLSLWILELRVQFGEPVFLFTLLALALDPLLFHPLHVSDVVNRWFVQMPDGVVRKTDDGELHPFRHLDNVSPQQLQSQHHRVTHLAESLRLSVLLEAKGREMDTTPEDAGFGQDTDTTNAIELHFDIRIAVWVAKVGQMGPPGGILGVTFHDDGVLVESFGQLQRRFGLLP